MTVDQYKSTGKYIVINKRNIFYLDRGDGPEAIVVLHGFPTSSIDYRDVLPQLSSDYRVVIHDQLGFGLSQKVWTDDYLITDQADIALKLWKSLGLTNIHIVAHNYGTSVATEILSRYNSGEIDLTFKSITLSNGSMLIDMAKLRPIQRMLKHRFLGYVISKLSNRHTFHRNMKALWFNKEIYDRGKMKLSWQLLKYDGGKKVLPKITRYINQRYKHYQKWIGALKESTLPIHILWAADDPVAVVGMADKLQQIIPNHKKTILNECGHYPMIEKPKEWLERCKDFIAQN